MMENFEMPSGATPLTPDELEGLLIRHITTRAELDRWEQENINEAMDWIVRRQKKDILTEHFIKTLHRKMFGKVWKWAGKFRSSDKNIGIYWAGIPAELRKLSDDVRYWIDNRIFPEDEISVRFHHRLVWKHLFSNGNGRHARLATDILVKEVFQQEPFTWGGGKIVITSEIRDLYIRALREADENNYALLLNFVRS